MMYRSLVWAAFLAVTGLPCAAYANGPNSLWVDQLKTNDRVELSTAQYHFRFDIVDPASGEAQVALSRDGVHFGPADRVFLLGSTQGRHAEGLMFVRMGKVEVGKRVELAVRSLAPENRRLTGPVEAIQVTVADPMALP